MSDTNKKRPLSDDMIYLRHYRAGDAEALSLMTSREEIYRTTCNIPLDFSPEYAKWWIRFTQDCKRTGTAYEYGIFTNAADELVGDAGIVNVNAQALSAALVYYVHPDRWGHGLATRACGLLLPYAFKRLKLNRIEAVCMTGNKPSVRVLEKLGFSFEGVSRQVIRKDGVFYDVSRYGLLKDDYFNAKEM